VADRLPRRLLMIASDAVRAIVQSVIALAFLTDAIQVWHLAVSSLIFGVASAFFGPASTGLVPQIVSASRLQEANALLGLSRNATELFGPALAGILVATVGYSLIFAIDSASFVASLVCLVLMPRLPRLRPRAQSFFADAREGIREVLAATRSERGARPRRFRRLDDCARHHADRLHRDGTRSFAARRARDAPRRRGHPIHQSGLGAADAQRAAAAPRRRAS